MVVELGSSVFGGESSWLSSAATATSLGDVVFWLDGHPAVVLHGGGLFLRGWGRGLGLGEQLGRAQVSDRRLWRRAIVAAVIVDIGQLQVACLCVGVPRRTALLQRPLLLQVAVGHLVQLLAVLVVALNKLLAGAVRIELRGIVRRLNPR